MSHEHDNSQSGGRQRPKDETDVGAVYFQPGSESDLRRYPPQDVTCRRIRCLLRDYTDSDLADSLVQEVDEHVHSCRDCGLALSRSELEVLQLRESLAEDRRLAMQLPDDFTSLVMAQVSGLALAEQAMGDRAIGDRAAPTDFTRRVMDQVRREWNHQSLWQRTRTRLTSRSGVLGAAAGLILVAILSVVGRSETAVVRVVEAQGGSMLLGHGPQVDVESVADVDSEAGRSLRSGDRWPAAATIQLADQERAVIEYPFSVFTGAPATVDAGLTERMVTLALYGPAKLVRASFSESESASNPDDAMVKSAFALHGGAVDFVVGGDVEASGVGKDTPRRDGRRLVLAQDAKFSFRIDETCRLVFAAGEYFVSVEAVRRFDVPSMERVLRVRLEVVRGRAWVLRGVREDAIEVVGVDWVAQFDAWSPILRERSVDSILREREEQKASPVALNHNRLAAYHWHGKVVDEFAFKPIANAMVRIVPEFGESFEVRTDEVGEYEFTSADAHGALALVEVRSMPPGAGSAIPGIRWAAFGPRPLVVTERRPGRLSVGAAVLTRSVRIEGRVLSSLGGLSDARVVPCVVDSVLGLVEPLEHLVARTDVQGHYELDDVPIALGPGQVLALVVEHDAHPTRAFLSLGRRPLPQSGAAHDLVVFEGQALVVSACGSRKTVELLQGVPGLPLRAFATSFQAVSDGLGVAEFKAVGPGECWLVDRESAMVTRVVIEQSADGQRVGKRGSQQSIDAWPFRRWLSGTSRVSAGRARYSAGSRRYSQVGYAGKGVYHDLAVSEEVDSVLQSARVQLFLLLGNGEVRFLGDYDGVSPFEFEEPVERPYSLYAIDADGKIGVLSSSEFSPGGSLSIQIGEGGAVDLSSQFTQNPGLEPVLLGFKMLEGPRRGEMVWRLFEPGSSWSISGMIPGLYELRLPNGKMVELRIHPGGSWSPGAGAGGATGSAGDPGGVDPTLRDPGGDGRKR